MSPGYIITEISSFMPLDQKMMWRDKIPMGREGEVRELKGAFLYLASDAASYTTGLFSLDQNAVQSANVQDRYGHHCRWRVLFTIERCRALGHQSIDFKSLKSGNHVHSISIIRSSSLILLPLLLQLQPNVIPLQPNVISL